jgi:hypothetical protein
VAEADLRETKGFSGQKQRAFINQPGEGARGRNKGELFQEQRRIEPEFGAIGIASPMMGTPILFDSSDLCRYTYLPY